MIYYVLNDDHRICDTNIHGKLAQKWENSLISYINIIEIEKDGS